ncbi:MAG: 30S ribosomal protein S16 [Pirellulaceae bacterium]
MTVRIRLKKMGRKHRPFYRICAMDARTPRDGRPIEELGFYDPMVKDANGRVVLKAERIDYWLGVGAQPSEKVQVLIKKFGTNGTHLEQQRAALERLKTAKPKAPPPMVVPRPKKVEPAPAQDESAAAASAEHSDSDAGSSPSSDAGSGE